MQVDLIINRGTINIEGGGNVKSGTTSELAAGSYKVSFAEAYPDDQYDLSLNVYDQNGVPSGYTRGILESDGFNITLAFNSIVSYVANRS